MPKIVVLKAFKFAADGIHVREFQPAAEPVEVSERCAEVALAEKWAEAVKPVKANPKKDD